MSIIRKLIIKEWLKGFFTGFSILMMLVILSNFVAGVLRSKVTTYEVIMNILISIPEYTENVIPSSCLIATSIAFNKIIKTSELTAIYSIGFDRKYIIRTILYVSGIIALLQFFVLSFIQPYIKSKKLYLISDAQKKFSSLKEKGLMISMASSGKMWYRSDKYFLSFSLFDKNQKILRDVTLYFFDNEFKLKKKIYTENIVNIENNRWIIPKGIEFNKLNKEDFSKILKIKNKEIIMTETPKEFTQIEADLTTLNITELYRYIRNLKKAKININEYFIILLKKISTSISSILFALFSLSVIFNPTSRLKTFKDSMIFSFFLIIVYWLINSYFIELGKNTKLNPIIATFLIPFLFSIYIMVSFFRKKSL